MENLVVWCAPGAVVSSKGEEAPSPRLASPEICVASSLSEALAGAGAYAGILWAEGQVEVATHGWSRSLAAMESGADLVYGDYRTSDGLVSTLDSELGSLRQEFDTGPLWLVKTGALLEALKELPGEALAPSALRYALRLGLLRRGTIRLPEPLTFVQGGPSDDLFGYVRADARREQSQFETVLSDHLQRIGAWLPPRTEPFRDPGSYPVRASVVIPVRNRSGTIGDAVASALSQKTEFPFNVLVIDNHSTDGTAHCAGRDAKGDARLHIIVPQRHDLSIGGCWNVAAFHPSAGRILVQLDSDDVYASDTSLNTMVRLMEGGPWAMAVGAYRTVDMAGEEVSPGLVDHREWTDENGHNNLLRVSGIGAPRAVACGLVRAWPFPDVGYGEDYCMALRVSRRFHVARTFEPVYLARRWEGNTDHGVMPALARDREAFKNRLRTLELRARMRGSEP